MTVRFLLHDRFTKGGGVLTVTFGLAQALSRHTEVEIVSLYGAGADPVHQAALDLPGRTLIDRRDLADRASAADLNTPSAFVTRGEPRRGQYNRHTDAVLSDYLGSLRDGVLVTMQPGLNLALAELGTDDYLRIAQEHRPFQTRPAALHRAYRARAARYDAFLGLTQTDADGYGDLFGDQTLVQAMPNGSPPYAGPTSDLSAPVAIAVGRLERSKGFDLLVDAWVRVHAEFPQWQVAIYGEGAEHQALTDQIADRGLTGVVRLMGYSTQIQTRMAETSLFVMSSRAEGYPTVMTEAMATGLPVVSTDCPNGPRAIIDHGVDGFLVPNDDADALAEGIIAMLRLPDERRVEMATAALAKAHDRSFAAIAERWLDLFDRCRERRGSSVPQPSMPPTTPNKPLESPVKTTPVGLTLNAATVTETERTYVLFGTRRGGTSMVAGILRGLGLDLGQTGARKNNEDPRFHPRPWRELAEVVEQRNAEAPVWGWKYPQAVNYLADIYPALRNPYFIVIYRDPVAAALSGQRLDKKVNARTEQMAINEANSNNAANTGFVLSVDRPCLLLSNERALADPEGLVDTVAEFIGVAAPTGDLRERILAYIQPGAYKPFSEYFPERS
ncbi:MAG: glycosyltransferase [Nocardioides sp.]